MDDGPIKLNLGCGIRHWPGFVNCDLASNWCKKAPDVACDVFARLPFPDAYADEVHAYHVAEHCFRWQIEDVLKEWARVLKPGGLMVLELPCLDKVLHIFRVFAEQEQAPDPRLTMWGLYGDPGYKAPEMTHKWCYSMAEMLHLMANAGITAEVEQPKTHQPVRDMRLSGRKCDSIHLG